VYHGSIQRRNVLVFRIGNSNNARIIVVVAEKN
jgi:hypothetical protein